MTTRDNEQEEETIQPKGKLALVKNKIIANIGSSRSPFDIVRRGVFYIFRKGIFNLMRKAFKAIFKALYIKLEQRDIVIFTRPDLTHIFSKAPYDFWMIKNLVRPHEYPKIRKEISLFAHKPLFSILLYVDNNGADAGRSIASFEAQLYTRFEVILLSASPDQQHTSGQITFLHATGPKADALNKAMGIAKGDFILTVSAGDTLTPDALASMARLINRIPTAEVIYSDEDVISGDGTYHSPCFKPDWSPDNLLSVNYTGSAVAVKTSLAKSLGGWRSGIEPVTGYDLLLRVTEKTEEIYHIPEVLYHAAEIKDRKRFLFNPEEEQAAKQAIAEAMERRGEPGHVIPSAYRKGIFIPRYKLAEGQPKVSIIIPTKDKIDILKTCIDSIFSKSTYKNYEVILIDNNSSDPAFFAQVKKWEVAEPTRFSCHRTEKPFNFAYLMNFGASKSSGSYYLLLNNDTEVITPDWIEAMLEQAQRPATGIVGAKLLYPDKTVQHAGVILGLSGVADHVFVGVPKGGKSYFDYIHRVINYSALTAACFMISKKKFDEVNGFNEAFEVEYNDLDFCLRIKEAGYNNIYLPHVELYHYESISRGHPHATSESYQRHIREISLMKTTWKKYIEFDPCYNPHLTAKDKDMRIAY